MKRDCNSAHKGMSVEDMVALIEGAPPGPWPHKKDTAGVDVWPECWAHWANTKEAMRRLMQQFLDEGIPDYPGHYEGKGIVIGGGGPRYFVSAWVAIRSIRATGCQLPIQLWYLGTAEMDPYLARILKPYNVQVIDARSVEKKIPARILCGWELKGYATAFCSFKEVLYLDADNVPLIDPAGLFASPEYTHHGACFWPDFDHKNFLGRMKPALCEDLGIRWRDEPSFESGQFLVNKERCWAQLMLTWWILEHSDYYFVHFYGDKEAFHVAWRRLETDWGMTRHGPGWEANHTIVQHGFNGSRLFLHRCQDKWKYGGGNRVGAGLENEYARFDYVKDLRAIWNGVFWGWHKMTEKEAAAVAMIAGRTFLYKRLPAGNFAGEERPLQLLPGGKIGLGAADRERRWAVHETSAGVLILTLAGNDEPTCHLTGGTGAVDRTSWSGVWIKHERCGVLLTESGPSPPSASPQIEGSAISAAADNGRTDPETLARELLGIVRQRGYHVDVPAFRRALAELLGVTDGAERSAGQPGIIRELRAGGGEGNIRRQRRVPLPGGGEIPVLRPGD